MIPKPTKIYHKNTLSLTHLMDSVSAYNFPSFTIIVCVVPPHAPAISHVWSEPFVPQQRLQLALMTKQKTSSRV